MLGINGKTLLLVALNTFADAIAIAVLGVASEVIYRFFVWFGALDGGWEFFSLLGCLGGSAVLILLRSPKFIRLLNEANVGPGVDVRRLSVFGLQIATIAIVGYALWFVLYGGSDVPLMAWLIICFGAASFGLVPYLLAEWKKKH